MQTHVVASFSDSTNHKQGVPFHVAIVEKLLQLIKAK